MGKFSNENRVNLNETGANAEELGPEYAAQGANEPNFSTQHELATELKFDAEQIKINR